MAPDKRFIKQVKSHFKSVKKVATPKPPTPNEIYRRFVCDFLDLTKSRIKSFETRLSMSRCVVDLTDYAILGKDEFIVFARNFFLGHLKHIDQEDQNEEENRDFLTLLSLNPRNKVAQEIIVKLKARNNLILV
jgi:hypothetical protein